MVALSPIIFFIVISQICASKLDDKKTELLNWCLDGKNHKERPGKEDELHGQCLPWKDHACCTHDVTVSLHENNMYNFTLEPCPGEKLSEKCRKFFLQDNCFYECEPNIGLWVEKTTRKIATERFKKVPLCASECKKWFETCKNDYTCAHNWPKDFKFSKGVNSCKPNSKCVTYQKMYKDAEDFCENVWDHSWKYTPDDQPCMKTWFDSSNNPNRKVAEFYIEKKYGTGSRTLSLNLTSLLAAVMITYIINYKLLH